MFRHLMKRKASIQQKLRRLALYLSRRQGAKKAWRNRHRIVFQKHPDYNKQVPIGFKTEHQVKWSPFWRKVPLDTLKICYATSGKAEPGLIPEEIFQADIEPSLNRYPEAHFLSNKSFYSKWLPDAGFPDCLMHKSDGRILNYMYEPVSLEQLPDMLALFSYPVIVKPSVDSYGGSGVRITESPRELLEYIEEHSNLVVQQLVRQSKDTARFHPESLNTVRVYLYRSVRDNRIHIVNRAFRTGNGNRVDNVAAGGLISLLHETGELNGYALDRYGKKYRKHPVTKLPFKGKLPNSDGLDKLAKKVAGQLFHLRIVGLDLYCDEENKWNMLEMNTKGHSIRFAQYHGQPFFGEFTGEVIEYCKENHWAYTV